MTSNEGTMLREAVRERYAVAAASIVERRHGGCADDDCGCGCGDAACCADERAVWGSGLYDEISRGEAPTAALLASLGCGNPTAVAELSEGETVLDLGSGGGLDVILSARRVGPRGKAYGLDMTDEMLALSRANAARADVRNVEFLKGFIEDLPLPDASVDVIISNCVVNLSPEKDRVFGEAFRVLRPGGRLAVTDVVADSPPASPGDANLEAWSSCLAGALTRQEYSRGLQGAGFEEVSIEDLHRVAPGFASAIVRATKPGSPRATPAQKTAAKNFSST